jgi:hypothetical protein
MNKLWKTSRNRLLYCVLADDTAKAGFPTLLLMWIMLH